MSERDAGRETHDDEPLLGESEDRPIGGEGPTDAVADHTPDEYRRAREDQPLLDD